MKKISMFFGKPFRYTACFSLILILFSVYVLLDAFVIPKVYAIIDDLNDVTANTEEQPIEPIIIDMSYNDGNIDLKVERFGGVML